MRESVRRERERERERGTEARRLEVRERQRCYGSACVGVCLCGSLLVWLRSAVLLLVSLSPCFLVSLHGQWHGRGLLVSGSVLAFCSYTPILLVSGSVLALCLHPQCDVVCV